MITDFNERVRLFLTPRSDGDFIVTLIALCIFIWIGRKASQHDRRAQSLGVQIGVIVAVYVITVMATGRVYSIEDMLLYSCRGAIVGGLCMAVSWIALPVVFGLLLPFRNVRKVFYYTHLLFAWIIQTPRRRRLDIENAERDKRSALEHRKKHEERCERERQQHVESNHRQSMRARCELAYSAASHKIEEKLSRNRFLEYMHKYMGDAEKVECVEERGNQLLDIIRKLAVWELPEVEKRKTLADYVVWFAEEKRQIESLPPELANGALKEEMISNLLGRFGDLQHEFLRKVQP